VADSFRAVGTVAAKQFSNQQSREPAHDDAAAELYYDRLRRNRGRIHFFTSDRSGYGKVGILRIRCGFLAFGRFYDLERLL
jgi:hypothetical protein